MWGPSWHFCKEANLKPIFGPVSFYPPGSQRLRSWKFTSALESKSLSTASYRQRNSYGNGSKPGNSCGSAHLRLLAWATRGFAAFTLAGHQGTIGTLDPIHGSTTSTSPCVSKVWSNLPSSLGVRLSTSRINNSGLPHGLHSRSFRSPLTASSIAKFSRARSDR